MATTKILNVLIVGGGIAGPVAGYWLAKAGHHVTIIEKSPILRAGGTQVDLRTQGAEVAKMMGLIGPIRPYLIQEAGIAMVDKDNNTKVYFGKGNSMSLTQEIEILRGDLVRALYDQTKDKVNYVFGKSVESFDQVQNKVSVTFSDSTIASYDVLIGADGLGSRTRRAIHPPNSECIKPLNMACAFWYVPRSKSDTDVARMYSAPNGKFMMLRTANSTLTQAVVGVKGEGKKLRSLLGVSEDEQKDFWISQYKGSGWETDRVLGSLKSGQAEGFYSTEIGQVKTPTWSKDRVVLLGDAAACPSPMTGKGTTTAFVMGYVLAGEIASHPDDLATAFRNYDTKLRPFIEMVQTLPGFLDFFMPETEWGIFILLRVAVVMKWFVVLFTVLKLDVLLESIFPDSEKAWALPQYPALT